MIYVLDGDSKKAFAVISVTYPIGSILTCSNGAKTLTAKDTTGLWNFYIPSAGNWTVTATDNGNTASKTIEITTQNQGKEIEVTFETIIFDSVNGLGGGYSSTDGDVEIGQDSTGKYILFDNGGGYNNMSYLSSTIDMTDYAYLDLYGWSGQSGGTNFGIWKKTSFSSDATPAAVIKIAQGTSPTLYTVEVFNLTGEYYIGNRYAQGPTTFRKISLRKE